MIIIKNPSSWKVSVESNLFFLRQIFFKENLAFYELLEVHILFLTIDDNDDDNYKRYFTQTHTHTETENNKKKGEKCKRMMRKEVCSDTYLYQLP